MFGVDESVKWETPHAWRPVPFLTPDYSKPEAWGLHPRHVPLLAWPIGYGPEPSQKNNLWSFWKREEPAKALKDVGPADVFFVHPTTHVEADGEWNADWNSEIANAISDKWPLQHQVSVFRGCGRIFAPRYRQAHLRSFYQPGPDRDAAVELAYEDVRAAFEWFLEYENNGRPIILAGHSQGSYHCIRLLMDVFDGEEQVSARERLVVAYLPGMQMQPHALQHVPPLFAPDAVGGYVTWMTASEGFFPEYYTPDFVLNPTVNPITWLPDSTTFSSFDAHLGILNRSFRVRHSATISARPHEGLLWIKPLKMALGSLVKMQDWHVADYNLFWPNIRRNAELRLQVWTDQNNQPS